MKKPSHHPSRTASTTTTFPTLLTELTTIQNLLALAWHRNKNQHRRSRWWQEFGTLKRGLGRLVVLFEAGEGKVGKGKTGNEEKEMQENQKRFLVEEVIPRCWV
jgi:ribonuclease MRP protein subunit RMP1